MSVFPSSAWLTIDDSPSARMDDLVDFLFEKSIPAIFYCRGDNLEAHMDSAVRAVRKGFTLANHTYSHKRAAEQETDWTIADIERCEAVLDEAYRRAGTIRKGRYFRFPHIDRGTAGWIVDYDTYNAQDRAALMGVFTEGLNVASLAKPPAPLWEKKQTLQNYLKKAGFSHPFQNVTAPWFTGGEAGQAIDSLYTFSNCDWMLTARHLGKWPYKNVDDLKERAACDTWLTQEGAVNVVLAHDQEEIVDITMELVDNLRINGLRFLEG